MKKEYSSEELLYKASAYCSVSEHCISEVKNKLQNWDASANDQDEIIDYLVKNDFINERRYSEAFVKDKFRFNKWGRIKIQLALKTKGIKKSDIDEALSLINETEYENLLISILKNKLRALKYNSEYEKRGKLMLFAQSKGFEYNIIKKTLDNL